MKKESTSTDEEYEETEAFISPEETNAALQNYSRALERRLKPTLAATFSLRENALKQLAELEQTDRALRVVEKECRSSRAKSGKPVFESRVNLGENFFVRAEAKRADKVVLDLGLGVFVEVGFREASKFVQQRRQMFRTIADTETKKVAEMQAMVEGVVKCLSGLQQHDGPNEDHRHAPL
ncbi:Prefoldin alpha-like protein [Gracilaria domingensis]|nr:Prefoldin alpha-like protein [Gracilaria domingensis]